MWGRRNKKLWAAKRRISRKIVSYHKLTIAFPSGEGGCDARSRRMRRVVGAVCIGSNSGSTNFLSQATANKVSRRALLNHHFVVPLLRWRMLFRFLCVHHGSFVNDPYEVLLKVIKISLFLVCEGRQPYLLCKLTTLFCYPRKKSFGHSQA